VSHVVLDAHRQWQLTQPSIPVSPVSSCVLRVLEIAECRTMGYAGPQTLDDTDELQATAYLKFCLREGMQPKLKLDVVQAPTPLVLPRGSSSSTSVHLESSGGGKGQPRPVEPLAPGLLPPPSQAPSSQRPQSQPQPLEPPPQVLPPAHFAGAALPQPRFHEPEPESQPPYLPPQYQAPRRYTAPPPPPQRQNPPPQPEPEAGGVPSAMGVGLLGGDEGDSLVPVRVPHSTRTP
jgi:hypothetical protein